MSHAVGIDVGSTNTKAVLLAEDGRVVAAASRPLAMVRSGDVAEQDAEATWRAVVDTVRELTAAHPSAAADVTAVGVCSQYSSIVPVDGAARPVGPMRLYLDTRGTPRSRAIMADHPEALGLWLERHGLPPYGSGLSLGHMLHLQHDTPAVHERTATWLEPMDFVTARLTGRVSATRCTMFAGQLCDNRSQGRPAYDDDLVRLSGIDPTRLPPLVEDGELLGAIQPSVASELRLPGTAVVVAAMNDSQAGALATGAFTPGRLGVVIGTTAVVLAGLDHLALDADHELASMPSPVPGRHLVWAENGIAGRAVEHVLGRLLDPAADEPFAGLEPALAASPAGAGGVLFLPWLTGSVAPKADPSMRGAFLNLSLDTAPADLARAAVEGTAHNLAWLVPAVEAFVGSRADEIVFAGGAARSPGWAQVLADVLDRPVSVVRDPSVAGAKAVALHALSRSERRGGDGDRDGAMPTIATTFGPDPSTRAVHDLAQAQFEAAFTALRPVSRALNRRPRPG